MRTSMIKFEWRIISNDCSSFTFRAKVIGGWIVRTVGIYYYDSLFTADREPVLDNSKTLFKSSDRKFTESMVFVHDPAHEWEL